MKKLLYIFAIICMYCNTNAQNCIAGTPQFRQMLQKTLKFNTSCVNTQQVHSMINQSQAILLDARSLDEYKLSHIKDAIWVGFENFDPKRIPKNVTNQNLIVYCSIGYRSEIITHKLKKMGYKQVYNYVGSIFDWVNHGFDIYDNQNHKTFKIHGYNKTWSQWITSKKHQAIY